MVDLLKLMVQRFLKVCFELFTWIPLCIISSIISAKSVNWSELLFLSNFNAAVTDITDLPI